MFTQTVTRKPRQPRTTFAARVRRSLANPLFEALAYPHGVGRYLEAVHPRLGPRTGPESPATVIGVRGETHDTVTMILRPSIGAPGFCAGQHVAFAVEIDGRRRRRTYSIASSAARRDGLLELTVKTHPDGVVSTHVNTRLQAGDVVYLGEPAGKLVLDSDHAPVLLISGGSGITPVMSMLRTMIDEGLDRDVVFLHYSRSRADAIYATELHEIAEAQSRVRVLIATTRDEAGDLVGHLDDSHIAALPIDHRVARAYACGPRSLVESVQAIWEEAGIEGHLRTETFDPPAPTAPDADATGDLVFADSVVSVTNDGRSILQQAEAAGLTPQSGCRMGICHTCIRPKISGTVRDAVTGDVSTCDPETIRICVSQPMGDVTIDL